MKQFESTHVHHFTRRDFLKVAGGLGISAAGITLLDACGVKPAAPTSADAPLETTTIRIPRAPTICVAPQYLAEDLLKSEGFTDVQYVTMPTGQVIKNLVSGDVDI